MKKTIGVYGYSGAGKSTFCRALSRLGARVIDADEVGRRILEKGSPLLEEIRKLFGDGVFYEDGSLNRKELGNIVFNSAEKLALLNSVTHPEIDRRITDEINSFKEGILIIDCAMIKEISAARLCDELVFITASEELLVSRLLKRENITRETAIGRIARQRESFGIPDTTVIENSGNEAELLEKAEELFNRYNTEE